MDEERFKQADKQPPSKVKELTVSELLQAQSLDEVFESFKKYEMEFETYLRPLMRQVEEELQIEQEWPGQVAQDRHREESAEVWAFLSRSILQDNKVCRDIVDSDIRDKYVTKMMRLRF